MNVYRCVQFGCLLIAATAMSRLAVWYDWRAVVAGAVILFFGVLSALAGVDARRN